MSRYNTAERRDITATCRCVAASYRYIAAEYPFSDPSPRDIVPPYWYVAALYR